LIETERIKVMNLKSNLCTHISYEETNGRKESKEK